ncbi:phosphoribosyl-ATP diphosphatase [Streptomyces phage BRock]|uniref:Phosphoribosyl-ATP diphosphatase n=1 Tax=Streptomyces phage BRock TaxID=1913591 RepID=A0A1J0GW69_9CAUD|nr:phosphoribosyl-ATP diphosphatase [Streptomyces phage BRock]APC46424.1 phosphoribosyl-ATP diphosphatase [Streptomyces phage BRock]
MAFASAGVFYMSNYNPLKNLKEFHETFSPEQKNDSVLQKIDRRTQLVYEEYAEVTDALLTLEKAHLGLNSYTPEEAMVEVASELADLLYVVYGTAEELGIPLDRVFNEIHKANMRKVWDDGKVHKNEFGKVLKPDNFQRADIGKVLYGTES